MLTGLTIGAMAAVGFAVIYLLFPFLPKWTRKTKQVEISPAVTTTTIAGAAPAPVYIRQSYLSKVRTGMHPVTLFGILAFTMIFLIFMLIPGDLVTLIGTILMGMLLLLILTSIIMLVTGWGSKLVWFGILIGSIWLAYNPPETTAKRVAAQAEDIRTKGLKSLTPNLPNIIYMSPEEKAAARRAEAERRVLEAEAEKQLVINAAVAQAAADAEAAKYRPLTADAFTTKTIGTFEPIVIKSGQRIGPIYLYQGTCPHWYKSGMGRVRILSRPDETSKPVEAKLNPSGYGVSSWGHKGEAFDLFFEAYGGDVKIELERREGDYSCS